MIVYINIPRKLNAYFRPSQGIRSLLLINVVITSSPCEIGIKTILFIVNYSYLISTKHLILLYLLGHLDEDLRCMNILKQLAMLIIRPMFHQSLC